MPGIFSRKFDHKNGESRVCKECGAAYHAKKPTWKCRKCLNLYQLTHENKKNLNFEKKQDYPFNETTIVKADARFCIIRNNLDNAWEQYDKTGDKSFVNAHYKKQLKEIEENGIMQWIRDRRGEEKSGYVKTRNMTRKEYPDTRNYYED